tara:strand:+ start:158 stop:1558 length:1401 start_codon:yes stop_codon:yes gene_type:complete
MPRIDHKTSKINIVSANGSFSLIPYLSEMVIYENIFRPALTGSIMISEAHNLPSKLPIVGEETLDVDLGIRDFENNIVRIKPPPFHLNSIKDREITKPKAQLLFLELVSEKFMSDSYAKVSRSYRDKKISEIVADIHSTYLDDGSILYVEPTNRIERCIIPNLSPIDAINWLSFRAIPDTSSNSVNYLFYETISGSFFVSINSLIKKTPLFYCRLTPRTQDIYSDGALISKDLVINVDKLKFINTFNRYQNIKRGIYASKLITHDIVKKKIIQHENNYILDWIGNNHLGEYPPMSISRVETKSANINRTSFAPPHKSLRRPTTNEKELPKMIDSRVEFYPKHDKMYCKWVGDSYDNKAEEWKLQRNSNIGLFQGTKIYVEGAGVSAVRVGQIVDLQVPSTETTDRDKMSDAGFDKSLSGNFMVTAIKHIFSAASTDGAYIEYRMGLELSKDGVEQRVLYRESRKED